MTDIMLDLETYGNTPGSMILSIGAQAFDWRSGTLVDDGMYEIVHKGGKDYGLHRDEGTVEWWKKQGAEARQVIDQAKTGGKPLPDALTALDFYVRKFDVANVCVWGCGSDFDNALIRSAYRAVDPNREPAWLFWNNRCYRTLKSFFPHIRIERDGMVHHNALDDARAQAQHAMKLLQVAYRK